MKPRWLELVERNPELARWLGRPEDIERLPPEWRPVAWKYGPKLAEAAMRFIERYLSSVLR